MICHQRSGNEGLRICAAAAGPGRRVSMTWCYLKEVMIVWFYCWWVGGDWAQTVNCLGCHFVDVVKLLGGETSSSLRVYSWKCSAESKSWYDEAHEANRESRKETALFCCFLVVCCRSQQAFCAGCQSAQTSSTLSEQPKRYSTYRLAPLRNEPR